MTDLVDHVFSSTFSVELSGTEMQLSVWLPAERKLRAVARVQLAVELRGVALGACGGRRTFPLLSAAALSCEFVNAARFEFGRRIR